MQERSDRQERVRQLDVAVENLQLENDQQLQMTPLTKNPKQKKKQKWLATPLPVQKDRKCGDSYHK